MCVCLCFFFFNDTATTEIYTLSLHDALPIFSITASGQLALQGPVFGASLTGHANVTSGVLYFADLVQKRIVRSEEHTSELQSRLHLVCRLLLEKKKKKKNNKSYTHTGKSTIT